MDIGFKTFAFVVSLVAVINALGIVRLLSAFAEYLRKRRDLQVDHFWVYYLQTAFQLSMHVLLWWSIVGLSDAGNLNFLTYVYLLAGPTLLFLGASLLIPELDDELVDLRSQYLSIRKDYFSVIILFWAWAIFVWPVFVGAFPPTIGFSVSYLAVALLQRLSASLRLHGVLVVANCLLLAAFVAMFAMQVGAVGRSMTQG